MDENIRFGPFTYWNEPDVTRNPDFIFRNCTISAILVLDIFAMEYYRDPNASELNDMIRVLGDTVVIWKL
ncbi:MAG: hypothetical protein M8353_07095 [ANME-2 cluster archaeon]|nr:hypothetical protein [ANME-2 cluster archaeon]